MEGNRVDDLDRASEYEQRMRDLAISTARSSRADRLEPIGECYTCGEELGGNRLFCNADCAVVYDRKLTLMKWNSV